MEVLEEQSKEKRSGRGEVVADVIENHSSFVAVGLQDVLPKVMQVHVLLLRTEMLQVDRSARDVSHLALLSWLVGLPRLPHGFPVVALYLFD